MTMIWYQIKTQDLLHVLDSSTRGLRPIDARKRLDSYGPNRLAMKKTPLWKIIIEPFKDIFVAVLSFAAIVSLWSGEKLDASIIAAIILINAIIYWTQQYATSRVLRSLRKHSISDVRVVRVGRVITISSELLVPGDIVLLSEGDRIPADARILQTANLQVNESSLTGESTPVKKAPVDIVEKHEIYDQENMVFQGTYVLTGTGRAVVVETGGRTEFGKIAALASETGTEKSPVQTKIDHLIALLMKITIVIAVFVFMLALFRGIPTSEALRFVLNLSVSAVPEGLPVALTVIIVLGMRRMAKQKALVRSFRAIEDIGLLTTIATDKTGTITKNHLTIVDSWDAGNENTSLLAIRTLDPKTISDPLDIAIATTHPKQVHHIDKNYPFDLALRMSGTFSKHDAKLYIKGAPEQILALSNCDSSVKKQAMKTVHDFTSRGYRVIAIATQTVTNPPENLSFVEDIELIGLIALADELRPEATSAIAQAQAAGISVRLITGDHLETAYHSGKTVGLAPRFDQVSDGTVLPKSTTALAEVIQNKTIFARILPSDKYRILQALKKKEIVAMTGDGVNDVPALTGAHIGFAMGSGSDIAKDAAGIVLLDDNFNTIVRAIREGRKIYDNIRRMLFYLLSTALGEVLTMIGALLFGLPLPVTAIQILWVNLVTDTAMVLPLGLEPEEEGVMRRKPRDPKEPLLSRALLSRTALIGLTIAILTVGTVSVLHARGESLAYIQTVAFLVLIVTQWANAFVARSEFLSSFTRLNKPNYGLLVGLFVAVGLQLLVMFGPLRGVFDIQPLSIDTTIWAIVIGVIPIIVVGELHKLFVRRFK